MKSDTKLSDRPLRYKLLWFVGLYLASVVVVGSFVYLMRFMLGLHG